MFDGELGLIVRILATVNPDDGDVDEMNIATANGGDEGTCAFDIDGLGIARITGCMNDRIDTVEGSAKDASRRESTRVDARSPT